MKNVLTPNRFSHSVSAGEEEEIMRTAKSEVPNAFTPHSPKRKKTRGSTVVELLKLRTKKAERLRNRAKRRDSREAANVNNSNSWSWSSSSS